MTLYLKHEGTYVSRMKCMELSGCLLNFDTDFMAKLKCLKKLIIKCE